MNVAHVLEARHSTGFCYARDPDRAAPVSGRWHRSADDFRKMEVNVTVRELPGA
jgi:hypothetical protein